jgi:hypothetical protein
LTDRKAAGKLKDAPPILRTLRRVVADHRRFDDSGPWEIDAAQVIDPDAAFAVLSDVIRHTVGRVSQLSRLEARWVTTLTALWGDLPPWTVYRLAREYIIRRQRKESSLDLDTFLAFAPWHESQAEAYVGALIDRLIPCGPIFLLDLIPGIAVPQGDHFTARPLEKLTGADAAKFKEQLDQLENKEAQDDAQR